MKFLQRKSYILTFLFIFRNNYQDRVLFESVVKKRLIVEHKVVLVVSKKKVKLSKRLDATKAPVACVLLVLLFRPSAYHV